MSIMKTIKDVLYGKGLEQVICSHADKCKTYSCEHRKLHRPVSSRCLDNCRHRGCGDIGMHVCCINPLEPNENEHGENTNYLGEVWCVQCKEYKPETEMSMFNNLCNHCLHWSASCGIDNDFFSLIRGRKYTKRSNMRD